MTLRATSSDSDSMQLPSDHRLVTAKPNEDGSQIRDSRSTEIAPAISVVIPSYNRCDSMLALLRDVSAQEDVDFEIIVVDDCSPDDSASAIHKAFPKVILLENEKNGGPAVSRNRGIREAKASIIVGFDSDVTVPDRRCLQKVLDYFEEHPDVDGLAFRLLQPDGKTEDFARWWHPVPLEKWADRSFYTSYFSGTGYAFRRSAVIAAGLYPEILYMHYEEEELAYRFLDQGSNLVYVPHISVVHHEHQVSRRSEIKTFYKHRNQILVALACYPWFRAFCYVFPRTLYTLANAARHGYLKAYFRAIASAKQLASVRLKERKPLQTATWRRIADMKKGIAP